MGDPAQVVDVIRDVLLENMQEGIDDFVVESAVYIGKNSGRLISGDAVIAGKDTVGGLRLTMKSGAEYDLKLQFAE